MGAIVCDQWNKSANDGENIQPDQPRAQPAVNCGPANHY
jgi:hypothetical protein